MTDEDGTERPDPRQAGWSYPPELPVDPSPLSCALAYARLGFRVFPVNTRDADKRPHITEWPSRATTDPGTLMAWWSKWPLADVGWVVPSTLVVVDLDVKNGGAGLADFERLDGRHPLDIATPTARTASGGLHLFFAVEEGIVANVNGLRRHGLAIDTRTTFENRAGMVILPTPLNGRKWLKSPLETAKADAPAWLKQWYRPPPAVEVAPARVAAEHSAFGDKALFEMCSRIVNAQTGERDDVRNQLAFVIGQYVGGGEMEESDAWAQVEAASLGQDWAGQRFSRASVLRRVLSAFNSGRQHPRNSHFLEEAAAMLDAAAERAIRES